MFGYLVLLAVAHLVTGVQFGTLTVKAIVEPYSSVKGAITYSKTTAPAIVKSQTVSGAPFNYAPSTTKPSGIQALANQTITITYPALSQVTYLYCIGWPVGTYVFSAGVKLRSHSTPITGGTLTGTSLKITAVFSGIIEFPTAKILKWSGTLTTAAATAKLIFTLGVPDIVCTAPTVDSSLKKGACTGVEGTTCTFTCGAGFKAATYVSAACTKNGTYSFTGANIPKKCTPITCTAPTSVSTSLKKGTCTGAYNSVCTYNCDTASGYVAQNYISKPCTVSGAYTFTPVLPTVCAASPCTSQPSSTIGLSTTCAQTISGAKCTRTCDNGYTGSVSFTCTRGSWGAATGVCAANPCNSEPTRVTGITTTSCSGKASGSSCSVTCDSGYTGTVSYLCTTGTWGTATGTCSANPCNSEPTLVTGITTTSCSGKASGSTCDVICDSGYTGSVSYLCTTGTWGTATGTCSANHCNSEPALVTGITTTSCSGKASGSSCDVTCENGYTGSVSYLCTTGTWGSATSACSANPCNSEPTLVTGITTTTCSGKASGSTCDVTCDSGYTGTVSYLCTTGTWGTATGACSANSCNSEPTLVPGITTTSCSGKASGSTCSVTCDSGYTGPVSYLCTTGTWGTATGTCSANPCNYEPTLVTGLPPTSCSGKASGSYCSVICDNDSGYSGSVSYLCTTGTWGSPTGPCLANPCNSEPTLVTGITATSCSGKASGSTCDVTCDSGYTGSVSYLCTTGTWGTATGTCSANPCNTEPTHVTGITTTTCTGTASGSTCDVPCDSAYTGTVQYTCNLGNWASSGSCTPKCLSAPSFTGMTGCSSHSNVAAGDTCTFTCAAGFTSDGNSLLTTCSNTGSWSTPTGHCNAQCTTASFAFWIGCSGTFNSGASCTLSCQQDYTYDNGGATITCNNGQWIAPSGNCLAPCTNLLTTYLPSGYALGACSATQLSGTSCFIGCVSTSDLYPSNGGYQVHCANGSWSTTIATAYCRQRCGNLFPTITGLVGGNPSVGWAGYCNLYGSTTAPVGTYCSARCATGYYGSGNFNFQCFDGNWNQQGILSCTPLASYSDRNICVQPDIPFLPPSNTGCLAINPGSIILDCTAKRWSLYSSNFCSGTLLSYNPTYEMSPTCATITEPSGSVDYVSVRCDTVAHFSWGTNPSCASESVPIAPAQCYTVWSPLYQNQGFPGSVNCNCNSNQWTFYSGANCNGQTIGTYSMGTCVFVDTNFYVSCSC